MSLPIETLRDITGKTLSVVLTIVLGDNIEQKTYPGCYAVRTPTDVRVFHYDDHQDGRIAYPRAVWAASAVYGVEHFGEHPEHEQWETSQMSPQQRQQLAKAAQQPPAGPDYPPNVISLLPSVPERPKVPITGGQPVTVMPLELTQEEIDAKTEAFMKPLDFPKDDGGTPPTSSTPEFTEDIETLPTSPFLAKKEDILGTSTSTKLPDADASEFWTAGPEWTEEEAQEEKPAEEGYKPRSRPTPHREPKPVKEVQQRTLKGSRGTAKRAVRSAGMALLLGFALLGFTPGR